MKLRDDFHMGSRTDIDTSDTGCKRGFGDSTASCYIASKEVTLQQVETAEQLIALGGYREKALAGSWSMR